MKTPIRFVLIAAAILSTNGCSTLEPKFQAAGTSIKLWFNKPETQAKIETAVEVAAQFLATAGLGYAQQSFTGVKINPTSLLIGSAITTLYSQASNIRKLQGTTQVLDPVATADALQMAGTPREAANKIGLQITQNIEEAVTKGLSPNKAAEQEASKLDTAAAIATNISSTK